MHWEKDKRNLWKYLVLGVGTIGMGYLGYASYRFGIIYAHFDALFHYLTHF